MTVTKIPLINGLNDEPNTDPVKGQNGAVVIAKVNELVEQVYTLSQQLEDIPSVILPPPQVVFYPETNSQLGVTSDDLNKLFFWGSYGGIKFTFYDNLLLPIKDSLGFLPSITIINITEFAIPLLNFTNINLFFYSNDPNVGPNNQALRSKGKLDVYFLNAENAYVVGSIINVAGY